MKNLRYICVQPAIPYYTWQVETVIHNFIKHGINPNNIDIVCAIPPGQPTPPDWRKLADTYNYVRFFFYEDNRSETPYVSSVRPHVLKQHFTRFPEMQDEAIFYFDCDMVFTRPPDWSKFLNDDTWYLSDTRFYVGAEYIREKGFGVYEGMCEIVGIDPAIPIREEENSGGAQYLMKNVNAEYWDKVEKDSDSLYRFFLKHLEAHPEVKVEDVLPKETVLEEVWKTLKETKELKDLNWSIQIHPNAPLLSGKEDLSLWTEKYTKIPKTEPYHPIQKWTADMWAVLWNGWYFKHDIKVVPEMEFVWGTQEQKLWEERTIFHNAGVLNTDEGRLFYKGAFTNTLPYDIENKIKSDTASYWYLQEVLQTGKNSCLTTVAPTTVCPT